MLNAGRVLSMCLMSQIQQWKLILIQRCVKAVEFVRLSVFSLLYCRYRFCYCYFSSYFFGNQCFMLSHNNKYRESNSLLFSVHCALCWMCIVVYMEGYKMNGENEKSKK